MKYYSQVANKDIKSIFEQKNAGATSLSLLNSPVRRRGQVKMDFKIDENDKENLNLNLL